MAEGFTPIKASQVPLCRPLLGSSQVGFLAGNRCSSVSICGYPLPGKMKNEPKPGEKLAAEDFDNAVRLTPLVAIDVVVRSPEGRILVGRRRNEPAKRTFFTTGGRITKNETLAAAFRRISLAELGVEKNIKEARFMGVFEHFYPTNHFERDGFGTHYVTLAYELTPPVEDA